MDGNVGMDGSCVEGKRERGRKEYIALVSGRKSCAEIFYNGNGFFFESPSFSLAFFVRGELRGIFFLCLMGGV